MREDNSSNVIVPDLGMPHKRCARSSIVKTSVSTFQDHRATPAASVATRSCHTSQSKALVRCGDMSGFLFLNNLKSSPRFAWVAVKV